MNTQQDTIAAIATPAGAGGIGIIRISGAEAEAVLKPAAVFASNTSTIPITSLAKNSARPKNFVGIHFFSPVDKMPLVEIIKGEKTYNALGILVE